MTTIVLNTDKERDDAIQSMKNLIDHNIREIMAGRAMLLKIEKLDRGDEKPLQETIDTHIADAGAKYMTRYDEMDFADVMLERLENELKTNRRMAEKIEELRDDLEALVADDTTVN